MSFLTYYGEDVPGFDLPRRVYGRIDDAEPADASELDPQRTIRIDCVDADWFDDVADKYVWLGERWEEADQRLSVVESLPGRGPVGPRAREGEWLEIALRGGEGVLHYPNLFAAPEARDVEGWYPVESGRLRERLEAATTLDVLPDATEDELADALSGARARQAVAIYDVGQGCCMALIDAGRPTLYFDFGGGVLRNRGTFPPALRSFCFRDEPPIVLSHWDFDHWSSGQRDPRALDRTWIVPRQRMGPSHTTFLGQILARGRVHVWPNGLVSVRSGDATVERCTGSRRGRNDSGLAVVVHDGDGEARVLLPADAGYDHVPSAAGAFASLAVPHHGGRASARAVPGSDGRASGRCVYSYGAGNSYAHPFPAVTAGHAAVWVSDLETPARGGGGLGHVHVYWDAGDPDAHPACGGASCDLTCQQR
jgi:hypothetical protein